MKAAAQSFRKSFVAYVRKTEDTWLGILLNEDLQLVSSLKAGWNKGFDKRWEPVTSPPLGNTAPGSLLPGTSCMQMSVSDLPVHTHLSEAAPAKSNMNKTGSQSASRQRAPPVVRRVLFQLDWVLHRPDWVLAKHLFISFSLYSFHLSAAAALFLPPSFSSSHPLSELRPGSTWASLYCATGKLPIRGDTLIEHWKQEFHKEADLLFITSRLLLFFPPLSSLSFFFGSWCLTRPASLSALFFYFPPALFPCCITLPSRGLPRCSLPPFPPVLHGWFQCHGKYCNYLLVYRRISITWIHYLLRGRGCALQEITAQYNIANLRNDREAITQETSRFRKERPQFEDWRRSAGIKEFGERLWV